MPSGRRVLLHLLPAGEILGHTALVGSPRVFEAVAYTDLRVGRIGAEEFLDAIAGVHAHEVSELVALVSERWISLVLRLARFLGQDLRARVAASLIEAARGFGNLSPNGQTLATTSTDGTTRLWDVASHRPIGTGVRASPRRRSSLRRGRQPPRHPL